ncbi:lysyl oxidase family protein [Streptomyces clavuligerus]|nr:lysyl oxidase family protein [Streptomyces clavuligerus]MBY6307402.1 protein-lysine 6-oxidase [Streptomyces clavuligerus]QCS10038.1 protein-lysine 6-oxidase [Streptomyces clavuligerus]QPJ97917.1 protein-lysine 6-oxidase [Streptomyces clavuligerus]WDN56744.1 protein-lysine 6-oxidase [Streptomyces clavuligerus]
MNSISRKRLWTGGLCAASVLAVTTGVTVAAPGPERAAATQPEIRLMAAAPSVELTRYEGEPGEPPGISIDELGAFLTVRGAPLEFRAQRTPDYQRPITVRQIIRTGGKVTVKTLPQGLVKNFLGLPDFTETTFTDAKGRVVASQKAPFCPNNASARVEPGGEPERTYPDGCPSDPFTLGSVWGVHRGWATDAVDSEHISRLDLPVGTYTAKISVTKRYRDLLAVADRPLKVKVTVLPPEEGEPPAARHTRHGADHTGHGADHSGHGAMARGDGHGPDAAAPGAALDHLAGDSDSVYRAELPSVPHALRTTGRALPTSPGDGPGYSDGSRFAPPLKPAAKRPTGPAVRSAAGLKPDLRAVPAWDIAIQTAQDGHPEGQDHLGFASTTWNAGPGRMLVDGFRTPGKEGLMDAYQYFYDARGKQAGYARTGTMEWDPRPSHDHWHFTDYAAYRLLKADKKEVVRSDKEAFCLMNNAPVDYTVKNANMRPEDAMTSTCGLGEPDALAVRQSIEPGSGDTYTKETAGQSFDITTVPNGTYWIQVVANPNKALHETSLRNNTSFRKVVLGGTPGKRTVKVPPHGLVNAG